MSGAVPKLRFPGFAGEWGRIKVGAIGPVLMCKRVMKDQTSSEGDVPFFKIGTFGKDADAFIEQKLFDEFRAKYAYPNPGDILISAAGTIGRLVVFDGKPAYFQDSNIVWVANDETRTLNPFLYYCYQNTQWTTEDTTIARLYNDNLRSIEIVQPNVAEQQKIADFLGTVDAKHEALRRKKSGLKAFKSGLMQRLFSQTLRFRRDDGTDFPDWEYKMLGDVLRYLQPTPYLVSSTDYHESIGTPVITAGKTFILGYTNEDYGIFHSDGLVILFDDFTTASRLIDFDFKVKSSAAKILLPKDHDSEMRWIFECISKMGFEPQVHQRHWIAVFQNLSIPWPHPDEQRKIADAIAALDAKIAAVADQITHMETFKKGLLQQMFV